MKKHYIIDEIKRTARENGGKPLGKMKFAKITGIQNHNWLGKYWARWGDAVKEAGYEPNKLQGLLSDDFLIEKIIPFIKELGKFPVAEELRMRARHVKDFPSQSVFCRVGKKPMLAKKIIEYCEKKGELEEVINICRPILVVDELESDIPGKSEPADGFVYLIKSGRYYKIGKTYDVGRRKYDIKLQLPEEIKEVQCNTHR